MKEQDIVLTSEEGYNHRQLFDMVSDPLFLTDNETGTIVDVNVAATTLYGYSRDEFLSKTNRDLSEEPEATRVATCEARPFIPLRWHRKKDGTVFPIEISASHFTWKGRPCHIAAIRDISERRKGEEALQKEKQRLELASLAAQVALWEWDIKSGRLEWTCAVDSMLGYEPDGFPRSLATWVDSIHPDDRAKTEALFSAHLDQGLPYNTEYRIRKSDGTYIWWHDQGMVQRDGSGKAIKMSGATVDISERKHAESELRKANRTMRMISKCHQALIHATDENELLNTICRIIVEDGGYLFCWTGYAEHDEAKSIRPVAKTGREEGFLQSLKVSWADTAMGQGSVGKTIRTGTPSVVNDIRMDQFYTPWREEALNRGYASKIAIPLKAGSEVFGALSIYSAEPHAFDEEEVELLLDMGNDLAYGIIALRTQAERELVTHRLELNESRLAALLKLHQMTNSSSQEIMDFALEEAIRLTGSQIGYLGLVNNEGTAVTMRSWSKGVMEQCHIMDASTTFPIKNAGIWNETIQRHKPCITNDYTASNMPKTGYPEGHIPITRQMCIPVFDGKRLVILSGVANKGDDYDESDVNQLTLLMSGMWQIMQRRETEAALRNSAQRLTDIINFLPDVTWVIDKDGVVIAWNKASEAFTGVAAEKMLGKGNYEYAIPFYGERRPLLIDYALRPDLTHPDAYDTFERHGDTLTAEKFVRDLRPGGVYLWVTARRLTDTQGNVIAAIECVRDITERKLVENALVAENTFTDAAINTIPGPFFVLDRQGRFVRWNRFLQEILGFPPEQIPSIDAIAVIHPEDREVVAACMVEVLEKGFCEVEARILTVDKREPHYIFTGRRMDIGADSFIVGIGTDITQRIYAERELKKVKNYLTNIIDSMPAVLVGMDKEEMVTQWNHEAERTTGIPAEKAVGQPISAVLPDFSAWIKALEAEIDSHHPAAKEKILLEKEGKRHFYDLMLYPLVANCVEGAVIRIEDVTQRFRVHELMVQTEKMMSVGGLAAGMAHEINNPLGIISQAIQNIERRVSPTFSANQEVAEGIGLSLEQMQSYFEQRRINQFLSIIRESSARAARIVANMLQFSRGSDSIKEPVNLSEMLEKTLELAASDYDLKKRYDFRSIDVVREYTPTSHIVQAVAVEIEQVFLNLLKNAAQAMMANPAGEEPRITLRLWCEEKYAVVEVEDNGPGMEESVRRRVFEPFFTTKEPGVGTGLGLSVSYMIITNNHKGLMSIESTPGVGTCFTVRLPVGMEK